MKKHIFSLTAFAALFFISCKKEATIKLPPQENKLVVTCFISPDDTLISASVRESVPQFGKQQQISSDVITNATVVLRDDANSATLTYDPDYEAYVIRSAAFAIVSGKTYYLVVSTPDGKEVRASTTVPVDRPNIQSLSTHTQNEQSSQGPGYSFNNFEYSLNIAVDDISGKTDYLEFYFQDYRLNKHNDTLNQNHYEPDTLYTMATTPFFVTDESVARNGYSYNYTGYIYGTEIEKAEVNVSVINCSLEFYKYNESATRASNSDGNLFAEPVFVYSNISNGLGCFGAYLSSRTSARLR